MKREKNVKDRKKIICAKGAKQAALSCRGFCATLGFFCSLSKPKATQQTQSTKNGVVSQFSADSQRGEPEHTGAAETPESAKKNSGPEWPPLLAEPPR